MDIAEVSSRLSRDHSKLGCVAIHTETVLLRVGVNGYISGYDDSNDKCGKHAKVIHAEMNTILTAKPKSVDVLSCIWLAAVSGLYEVYDCLRCKEMLLET